MYLHPLDQVMKLVILRGGARKILEVPVVHRDSMDKLMDTIDPDTNLVRRLGILAVDLTPDLRSVVGELRISSGVVVVARAADLLDPDTGLKSGDVIHSVNNTPIDSVIALRAALRDIKSGAPVVLQLERSGGLQWLAFEME
jgi:serine protease Do